MTRRIYIYDLSNHRTDQVGEPIFWIADLGRFIGFDEMDYDIEAENWYVKLCPEPVPFDKTQGGLSVVEGFIEGQAN